MEHVTLKTAMISMPHRLGVLGILFAAIFATRMASAETKVGFLIDQLKNATDFRLRTQAALSLGASDDPTAVTPLCGALDDTSDSVRSAAAAALGKLKNAAGLPCLRDHMSEPKASVRSVIERSMTALQGSAAWPAKPPPPGPNDTFYVAVGPSTDKAGGSDKTVEQIVGQAMQEKLLGLRGYAVAPQGETSAAAGGVIKRNNLKGYFLQARVEPPKTNSNGLTIQVRITMWSYPSKALQGEF